MNKFAKKMHAQYLAGELNAAIFNYMYKIAETINNEQDFALIEEQIRNLAELDIKTQDDCIKYFKYYTALANYSRHFINSNKTLNELIKYAFAHEKSYDFKKKHNYAKLILDFININKNLIKVSYPNNSGIESSNDIVPPFNLDKWIEAMRYIYDITNTNNLSLDNATNQVIANWSDIEKNHFKRWMKYYQEGNYNKYNVKTAQLFSTRQDAKIPDVKDMFQPPSGLKPDPMTEKKQRLNEARSKLRSRLKSIEELLEAYRDVLPNDATAIMRKDVFDLKEKIFGLELKASLVDSIIRTSNRFNKYGFVEGANELKKIAQEVAEDKLPPVPVATEISAPKKEELTNPKQEATQSNIPNVNVEGDNIEIPDFNSATHKEALQKLEEINKVISERNVVRALAAVDIILGQLGIASHFPQLSEAQSKLMDAFNYAGTRVAETIGLIRGGGGKEEMQDSKPQQDVVEVKEDIEKPVGEVISGGPKAQVPAPKV